MLYNRVRTARSRKRAADRTRALRDHARTLTNGIRRGREGSGSEEAGGEGGGEGGGGEGAASVRAAAMRAAVARVAAAMEGVREVAG